MKKKIKLWYCEVCEYGVVSPTPICHRTRYSCINCSAVYFANGKRDLRYKPMNKSSWIDKKDIPSLEDVTKAVEKRK